jgi:hypothetical protein
MLQANPGLTPAQVLETMRNTAIDIETPGPDTRAGQGLIDALAALEAVLPAAPSLRLAMLGENGSTNRVRVQLKDALTGARVRNISFSPTYTPRGVVVVPDQNGNGTPELGVLGYEVNTGQVRVYIKDALTGTLLRSISFNARYIPQGAVLVPDQNGNGTLALGVLGQNGNSGKVQVQLKDALTKTGIGTVYFDPAYNPRGIAVLEDLDGNGIPELAVLGEENGTGEVRVQLKDASTGVEVGVVFFGATHTPWGLAIVEDQNGNGVAELAVLQEARTTGRGRVQLKDALTGEWIRDVTFSATYAPRGLTVITDQNGNGVAEFAVLVEQRVTGQVRVLLDRRRRT